jgi:hypothetical protein
MNAKQGVKLNGHAVYDLFVDILSIKSEVWHCLLWISDILQVKFEILSHLLLDPQRLNWRLITVLFPNLGLQLLYFFVVLLQQLIIFGFCFLKLFNFALFLIGLLAFLFEFFFESFKL